MTSKTDAGHPKFFDNLFVIGEEIGRDDVNEGDDIVGCSSKVGKDVNSRRKGPSNIERFERRLIGES